MPTRRTLLAALVTAASGLAGCATAEVRDVTTATRTGMARGTEPTGDMADPTDDQNLREANVVDVAFDGEPGGDVRFDVTLLHDDDGEDGYANWWQVEALDGTQLGRRELLHAHSTAPFTRSTTVDVPADVGCVVVRGHDQTHGYGGQAMLVNLETGATRAVDQGSEPGTFDASDCP